MAKKGRKSKYETVIVPNMYLIETWARQGASDKDIYQRLGVSSAVFYKLKNQYKEFKEALSGNKVIADQIVVNSLYQRAKGIEYEERTHELQQKRDKDGSPIYTYSKDEDGNIIYDNETDPDGKTRKIARRYPVMELVVTKEVHKFIPPDESSIEFWLSNRQPDEWKRKQEVTGNINNNNLNMTPEDLKNLPFDELQNRIKSLAKDLSEAVVK